MKRECDTIEEMKISLIGLEARNKSIKGMSYVANAVKATIGPYGQNVLIEKDNKITNDGITIAKELCPTIVNEFERRGALIANEASSKTNDMVGDATSTAWALTEAIVKEALRYLPNEKSIKAKKTPAEVIQMIQTAKEKVLEQMKAEPIISKEDLIKSALVSVEDENLAQLLGETQWELKDGQIIAEEVNDTESSIERVTGIRLDNGFGASHLITNPETQTLEVNDISILLTNYTIGKEELLLLKDSVFKQLISQKKLGIVIVARAFTSEAIKLCQESAVAGFAIFPVNAPYVNQKEIMKDIETVVGGRYIDTEESTLTDIYITDIGFCKRLVAKISDAVVTGMDNDQAKVRKEKRVEHLHKELKGEKSEFAKKMLETRIAQLTNGFAILKVGSHSLANRKRLKDKADDAVQAVRLALKGGTVKGGGLCLKEISERLEEGNILKRPLLCVYEQIISSAPDDFVIEDWVRDPYLVLKCALENACETAAVFSSINGSICEENKSKIDLAKFNGQQGEEEV